MQGKAAFRFSEVAAPSFPGMALSRLASASSQDITALQISAWEDSLDVLQKTAAEVQSKRPDAAHWGLILEYRLQRRERRIDAVLVSPSVAFPMEFKTGDGTADSAARWQLAQYAMDLRDYHPLAGSMTLRPLLVSRTSGIAGRRWSVGQVEIEEVNPERLAAFLQTAVPPGSAEERDLAGEWNAAGYRPTPTIIEAATDLFASHDVAAISHSYATNLDKTVADLIAAVAMARAHRKRVVCFVTGVPGAGKTLTGLAMVHSREWRKTESDAGVFLTGNGPLRRVLVAALAQSRAKAGTTKADAVHQAEAFIQSIHRFVADHAPAGAAGPTEHVFVFDEAQRAWTADKIRASSKRARPGQPRPDFGRSEPALVLDILEKVPDWCVLAALVGGGQEIHEGEAGLAEWGRALSGRDWEIHASPEALLGGVSVSGAALFEGKAPASARPQQSFHLTVSTRSPRAQHLAAWVEHVLGGRPVEAKRESDAILDFPILLCRDLDLCRAALRALSLPGDRAGLVASSSSHRHRAYGLEMNTAFHQSYPLEAWFLKGAGDVRSSDAMEFAATEFECQGLELDWVGLCWAGDLTKTQAGWNYRDFKSHRWQQIRKPDAQQYRVNKYRVLLTRARKGMIIWVPRGRPDDATLAPAAFDDTAAYLRACGLEEVSSLTDVWSKVAEGAGDVTSTPLAARTAARP